METNLEVEFMQKIEYENEKIKALMLGTSKANIYASSKEIYLKKYIRNVLSLEFIRLEEDKKLVLLCSSDLIENIYSRYHDKDTSDFIRNNNQGILIREIIEEILAKEGGLSGKNFGIH